MPKPVNTTKILGDGLRYKSKVIGSPFKGMTHFNSNTMSCFQCGTHRIRTAMGNRKLMGKWQAVCAPSCKEANQIATQASTATLDEPTA